MTQRHLPPQARSGDGGSVPAPVVIEREKVIVVHEPARPVITETVVEEEG